MSGSSQPGEPPRADPAPIPTGVPEAGAEAGAEAVLPGDAPAAGADVTPVPDVEPAPTAAAVDEQREAALPTPAEASATTGDEDPEARPVGPSLSFGFNLGKIAGQGEDSDPILRHGRELGLVGVFDGLGGAGGTVYETADGPRTGAYLASRVARDVVERRMLELLDPEWHVDGPAVAQALHDAVLDALQQRLAELKAPPSGLRSKLLRALPTTMALLALQRLQADGDTWAAHLFSAGDSRAYVLTPSAGLQQLTVDDIRDQGDAMANLREDSVVSNAMSASTDFAVHHRQVELTAPFLVIAATDGCFGYVPTPMHVEHLLLTALHSTENTEDWSTAVQAQVSAVTGDDAAMSVLGIGADFRGFQELLAERAAELATRFIAPLDAAAERVRQLELELERARAERATEQAQLWAAYKPDYARHLRSQVSS